MDSRPVSGPKHPVSAGSTSARRIAGVALLREDRSALMQLRDDKPGLNASGLWVFPGGHCEPGESAEVAARREFLEETGYVCDEIRWVASFAYPSDDRRTIYELNIYACRYDGVQAVQCYEGQRVEFIPREHASGYPMPPYVPGVWDMAISVMQRPLVRSR
jgi:8-oxo-dGTP diphosphatase